MISETSDPSGIKFGRKELYDKKGVTIKLLGGIKTLDKVLIYSTVFFWIATSSLASRNAVENKSLSLSSYLPPGKLICPECTPGYLFRSIKTKLS